jgi:hypothetical protein
MSNQDPAANEPEFNADEIRVELAAQDKKDLNTATVRTALPTAWTAVALWAINRWGIDLTLDDLYTLAPVALVVGGIVYRLARFLEVRFPLLGHILLGSANQPAFYN